jgi:hypothetical protein
MDGMYAGFAGAKTGANLAKDNQPWPSACALHLHPSGHLPLFRGALALPGRRKREMHDRK